MPQNVNRQSKKSLYEQLYESIKTDILSGRLAENERLPSKRELSERLGVSIVTVQNAYSQLIAEGYVRAEQRSGYFVQYSGGAVSLPQLPPPSAAPERPAGTSEHTGERMFPFTVWARLMRSVILEKGTSLLTPVPNGGAYELCSAISDYLYRARGIAVPPHRVIVGAGTEYLCNLLIQLLGREHSYGVENPGYDKLAKIYALNGVRCVHIGLDGQGMSCAELERSGVTVAHISPAHHFPTGIVMPISRRREIMRWAESGSALPRYIIEDDYDSELRWSGRPVPTMAGMDSSGRVIYINTFSQTIAPSVRISYMCLPEELYGLWRSRMGFYSCSVPAFEQYTLARFISEGYFERHISRMKKRFRRTRELVLELMRSFEGVEISEENAGLHFLMSAGGHSGEIIKRCGECGIRFTPLGDYYSPRGSEGSGRYVVNYAAADEELLTKALSTLPEKT